MKEYFTLPISAKMKPLLPMQFRVIDIQEIDMCIECYLVKLWRQSEN